MLLFNYHAMHLLQQARLTDYHLDVCRGAAKGSGGFDTAPDGPDMPEGMYSHLVPYPNTWRILPTVSALANKSNMPK